ncbi:MAG: chemotaxis protein CheA [Gemmataceae bacterium]|nr:chemotaxis protein CheA [Gemmataceae bacterium]
MALDEPIHGPFAEFLDDYFVECEEHLGVARRSLLALEPSVGQPNPDRLLLDELFRCFHSIKGLSAMVDVRAAEQLAHQMESYLSALRKRQILTTSGLESLIAGVIMMEQVIAARRAGASPPDIASLLHRFSALASLEEGSPSCAPVDEPTLPEPEIGPLRPGESVWQFTFAPTPELAARGVNVNTVRERLQAVGEVVQAIPLLHVAGRIAFRFVVRSNAAESSFAVWERDSIHYEPYASTSKAGDALVESALPSDTEQRPAAPVPVSPLGGSNLVRVDLSRLDELMRMVGELVISRAHLDDTLKRASSAMQPADWRTLQDTNLALERQLRDLREGVMRVRMVPVREVFARMQFVVRDLTRESGKKVALELSGQDTEIDKFVVERMMDPLLHLVRNAVSHGLETSSDRAASGKSPEGHLSLRASTTGETILIEVEDDGRGIDAERVFARARTLGLVAAETAPTASLLDVLCAAGFSTRDVADRASGRGVGMAVVRTAVEELGGSLALDTTVGRGTRFTIQLPLTLAIADALIVEIAGQRYAVPQVSIREVIRIEDAELTVLENNEVLYYRGGVLPLMRLSEYFGLDSAAQQVRYALVTGEGLRAVGLAVDRVLGLREVVVRPLTDPLVRVSGIAGATELGDGHAVLILDASGLARSSRQSGKRDNLRLNALASPALATAR